MELLKSRAPFWEEELKRFNSSGMSVQEYCRSRGLSCSVLYAWRRRLGGEEEITRKPRAYTKKSPTLISIPILREKPRNGGEAVLPLEMRIGDILLKISVGTDVTWLHPLVKGLIDLPHSIATSETDDDAKKSA
jgi:hypothetical protein